MSSMWVGDCTYGYDGDGTPPDTIHFVGEKGSCDYIPILSCVLDRRLLKILARFFVEGECSGCPFELDCDPEIAPASDECDVIKHLHDIGIEVPE